MRYIDFTGPDMWGHTLHRVKVLRPSLLRRIWDWRRAVVYLEATCHCHPRPQDGDKVLFWLGTKATVATVYDVKRSEGVSDLYTLRMKHTR